MKNEELVNCVEEIITRISSMAELVDKVIPNQNTGEGIKQSSVQLKEYVHTLKGRAEDAEASLLTSQEEQLVQLATQECISAFKLLSQSFNPDLAAHARGLFDTLMQVKGY